jgi:hypothetical protein
LTPRPTPRLIRDGALKEEVNFDGPEACSSSSSGCSGDVLRLFRGAVLSTESDSDPEAASDSELPLQSGRDAASGFSFGSVDDGIISLVSVMRPLTTTQYQNWNPMDEAYQVMSLMQVNFSLAIKG